MGLPLDKVEWRLIVDGVLLLHIKYLSVFGKPRAERQQLL